MVFRRITSFLTDKVVSSARLVWNQIPDNIKNQVLNALRQNARQRAVDLICRSLRTTLGFPQSYCELVADKVIDFVNEVIL